jgi:hypothetical protein
MRESNLRVWFSPEDIRGGKKLHEQIDHAIRVYDKLLLVLSPHSMNSEWVKSAKLRGDAEVGVDRGWRHLVVRDICP